MDIREEREDLKEAAEQSLNVILDLSLDCVVRWVGPSWRDVIGTPPESVQGRPIGDILCGDQQVFANAIESMKRDDSRSQIIRFKMRVGPSPVLKQDQVKEDDEVSDKTQHEDETVEEEEILNLEGQGIMVHDRSSRGDGGESHVSHMGSLSILLDADGMVDYVDDPTFISASRGDNRSPRATCRISWGRSGGVGKLLDGIG